MGRQFALEKIRNIGIIAHIDAGKTTTTERMLYYAGRIQNGGNVNETRATADGMPRERERGTLIMAAVFCQWRDCAINIIDTPDHVDLAAEVERSLRVLDGAVVCFDGVQGVEPQSETVWRQADKYCVPRVVYINKMDRAGADFFRVSQSIITMLGADACPIQIPIGVEAKFIGLIDLIRMKALVWKDDQLDDVWSETHIPAALKAKADECRANLVRQVVKFDDELHRRYRASDTDFSEAELKAALRKGVLQCKIIPVLCGSSYKNKGVQPLLDAVCDYLPAPCDLPPIKGIDALGEGRAVERRAGDEEPFSALVFKIQIDPFDGKVIFFRVYSGGLKVGDTVMFANNRNTERIDRIFHLHADQREEVKEVWAGDIAATVALKNGRVGYTMCDPKKPVILEQITFLDPVITVTVEPRTKADAEKMANALRRLSEEDQTFRVKNDVETGLTTISGMGELHLDVIVDRMKREFGVAAKVGNPCVAYRETIRKKVREESKFIRRGSNGKYTHIYGGRNHYANVVLELEPRHRGAGIEFVNEMAPGRIPNQFVLAVESGVREALEAGALVGYPLVDLGVRLVDGSFHEVDSSEMAFKVAGAMALRTGCKKAAPTILEPIMKCETVTPEQYAGDVIGDLKSRRAKISEMGDRGHLKFVRYTVPLSEMFGYATIVRSISQGRASFSMESSHYEEVPPYQWRASIDPHSPDDPPTASAGRPVRPIRPKPGLSGGERRPLPPKLDD